MLICCHVLMPNCRWNYDTPLYPRNKNTKNTLTIQLEQHKSFFLVLPSTFYHLVAILFAYIVNLLPCYSHGPFFTFSFQFLFIIMPLLSLILARLIHFLLVILPYLFPHSFFLVFLFSLYPFYWHPICSSSNITSIFLLILYFIIILIHYSHHRCIFFALFIQLLCFLIPPQVNAITSRYFSVFLS